jgi:hypothetical protein
MSAEIGLRSRRTPLNLVILVSLGLSICPSLLARTLAQEEALREMIAMNWAAFPGAFQSVSGGVVASNWADMGLKLLEFGRK